MQHNMTDPGINMIDHSPGRLNQSASSKKETSLLDRITCRRQDTVRARVALFRTTVNFFILVGIYFDKSFGSLIWQLHGLHLFAQYVFYAIELICALNFVGNGLYFVKLRMMSSVIELTEEQQRLFGVNSCEPGFRIVQHHQPTKKPTMIGGPHYSPSSFTGRPSYHPDSPPTPPLYIHSCNSPQSQTSPSGQVGSFFHGTPRSCLNSSCSPAGSQRYSPANWSPTSYGSMSYSSQHATSPGNYSLTPNAVSFQRDTSIDGTHIKNRTSPKLSPLGSEDCISNTRVLEQYLQEQDEKQTLKSTVEMHQPGVGGLSASSFWSYGRSVLDYLPALRHYQYQPAPRNPVSEACKDDPHDDRSSPTGEDAANIWLRLGVDQDQLEHWVENLRKWLGSTILARLVAEIDEVNDLLVRVGSEDIRVGESSLMTLKQVAAIKSQHLSQLTALLPYIDLTPNQEYLVQRIRDLAHGGCMSAFKWNGGAEYKRKPWDETLPTDSRILIHLFCAYLDARLPGNLKYPDGKTFTSKHFILVPDKPDLVDKKENMAIFMTRLYPPHFKVVVEGTVGNVKPGRHNLFHAILLFLHHIKVKEHGMLRRINLGMSGLNILWVLD